MAWKAILRKIYRALRYDWPLHFSLLLTNWLPDNVVFLRFRGWLAHYFLGSCGKNLRLGRNIIIYSPGNLHLGSDVYMAYGCVLISTGQIYIGEEVLLGPYVVLAAGNHTRLNGSYRFGPVMTEPIQIGSGAWVGAHCTVLSGACIGPGCVLGSNAAVIRGEYPANSFLAGVPAKVLKKLNDLENSSE